MYRIIDIIAGVIIGIYETQEDLIRGWCAKCGSFDRAGHMDTKELNITGKDRRDSTEPLGLYYFPGFGYIQGYHTVYHLRRYQVVDKYGRPQDIREWTDAIEKVRGQRGGRLFSYSVHCTGAKKHNHRINGPAMYRNAQRLLSPADDPDDELLERFHIVVPAARDIWARDDAYDRIERKYFGRYGQKSWKDSKVRSQWAKHKTGADRRSIRFFCDSCFGIDRIA